MRAILIAGALACLCAAAHSDGSSAAAASHLASKAETAARAPARLMVAADEWSLVLSRHSVARGRAIIQFHNRGEDPHDLRVERVGQAASVHSLSVSETRPQGLVQLKARLTSGRYRLYCSLPGHRARGMRAVLSVRRAR